MAVKKFVRNKTVWLIKLLGHRMGTRMTGLAPRPPFFLRPTLAWGPLLGSLGFLWLIFCAGHLWLGARLLGSLDYSLVFRLGVFVFLFLFSVSTSWLPRLWYEYIILAGLEFRIPRKSSLWGILQTYSFGSERLCGNDPLFQGRKGGLFLQGRSTSLPPKPGLKASIP